VTEPVTLPAVDRLTPIIPLTWVRPAILPVGLPALVDRFWATEGVPGISLTVHVESNGRPRNNPPPQVRRTPPYGDLWFVPTHAMSAIRGVTATAGATWLFTQWTLLLDALIRDLQLAAVSADPHATDRGRYQLDTALPARKRFVDRLLAEDDRLGQPKREIGGVVGALWGRRIRAWSAMRKTLRSGPDYHPAEYPRAVLDDLRAYECGGQHTLSHLVQTLLDQRHPGAIPFGETEQQVQATYRYLRNERYLLRYHLLNACPEAGIWRTVLARVPGKDGTRRVYHFFTAGERARLLALVGPRLPAPKPPPWPPRFSHDGTNADGGEARSPDEELPF
jgi:hypothetical protein